MYNIRIFRFNQISGRPKISPKINAKTTIPTKIARKTRTDRSLFFITAVTPIKKAIIDAMTAAAPNIVISIFFVQDISQLYH